MLNFEDLNSQCYDQKRNLFVLMVSCLRIHQRKHFPVFGLNKSQSTFPYSFRIRENTDRKNLQGYDQKC